MLKELLQSARDGVTEKGWLALSRNWGLFFAALGIANHVMYELIEAGRMSFDLWLTIKEWGVTALSFLFTLTQLPVMLKNGLRSEEHTSELPSLMRISYAVFCLKKNRQVPPDAIGCGSVWLS